MVQNKHGLRALCGNISSRVVQMHELSSSSSSSSSSSAAETQAAPSSFFALLDHDGASSSDSKTNAAVDESSKKCLRSGASNHKVSGAAFGVVAAAATPPTKVPAVACRAEESPGGEDVANCGGTPCGEAQRPPPEQGLRASRGSATAAREAKGARRPPRGAWPAHPVLHSPTARGHAAAAAAAPT